MAGVSAACDRRTRLHRAGQARSEVFDGVKSFRTGSKGLLVLVLPAVGGCFATARPGLNSIDPNERARAAVRAGRQRDHRAVPLLVDRLDDEDVGVRFYALLALKQITGTTLGYHYRAPTVERQRAIQRWREYVRTGRHRDPARPDERAGPTTRTAESTL